MRGRRLGIYIYTSRVKLMRKRSWNFQIKIPASLNHLLNFRKMEVYWMAWYASVIYQYLTLYTDFIYYQFPSCLIILKKKEKKRKKRWKIKCSKNTRLKITRRRRDQSFKSRRRKRMSQCAQSSTDPSRESPKFVSKERYLLVLTIAFGSFGFNDFPLPI